MNCKKKDIEILLVSLLLFSFGMHKLHARKRVAGLETLSLQEVRDVVLPLLQSRSVEKAAQAIRGISVNNAVALLDTVINDKSLSLTRLDLLQLMWAVAGNYAHPSQHAQIFELLVRHDALKKGKEPFLFLAARTGYAKAISPLLQWTALQKESALQRSADDAVRFAVKEDRFNVLTTLLKHGVTIAVDLAQELLWSTVDHDSDADFIPLFVKYGAQVNAQRKGKTPLMIATEHDNLASAQALFAAGAKLNTIVDLAVGSALQIAVEKDSTQVEYWLREQGARE